MSTNGADPVLRGADAGLPVTLDRSNAFVQAVGEVGADDAGAAGFVIRNNVLIVAGCLVGASGVILSILMCQMPKRLVSISLNHRDFIREQPDQVLNSSGANTNKRIDSIFWIL